MKPTPTRTLNRLPFQDLEPHRFEDLVRGIAHDFRTWKSLEDTGRGGADDGIDIRGTEVVLDDSIDVDGPSVSDDGLGAQEDEAGVLTRPQERTWIFQCKREQTFGPKDAKSVVAAARKANPAPHGFVLAVAADVTKKTRDTFRAEMVAWGVSEFHVWARGELEDMMLQPRYDALLFAFFGISLRTRRRKASTDVRSRVAIKRQLERLLTGNNDNSSKLVLVRDISEARYPELSSKNGARSRWRLWKFVHAKSPSGIVVETHEFLAWVTPGGQHWDALFDYDYSRDVFPNLLPHEAWGRDEKRTGHTQPHENAAHRWWEEYVPDSDKAYLHQAGVIPFESIVAIDPIGDGHYPIPQIFVDEWTPTRGPMGSGSYAWLTTARNFDGFSQNDISLRPSKESQLQLFPRAAEAATGVPPPGFSIETEPKRFSAEIDAQVENALAAPAPVAQNASDLPESTQDKARVARDAFAKWQTDTALPVMSAIARKVRAAGHGARVAPRVPTHIELDVSEPFVELRLTRDVVAPAGHTYPKTAHFRIKLNWHGAPEIERYPDLPDPPRGGSRPAERPLLETMTTAWLEAELVGLLARWGPSKRENEY